MEENKRVVQFENQEHQEKLIKNGIDPETLKPMNKFYYKVEDFNVYLAESGKIYYHKANLKNILKYLWGELKEMIKLLLAGKEFEYYVKKNKKYPTDKLIKCNRQPDKID